MKMRKAASLRLAIVAALAIGMAGCGKSPDGTTAQVDPNLGKRHKEMRDWTDNNKSVPGVNNKTMRNHP